MQLQLLQHDFGSPSEPPGTFFFFIPVIFSCFNEKIKRIEMLNYNRKKL